MDRKNIVKRLNSIFPYLLLDLTFFLLIISAGITVTISTAIFMQKSTDAMNMAKDVFGIKNTIITLIFLILLSGIFKFIQDYYPIKTMIKRSAKVKENIVEHLTKVDIGFLNVNKPGDIITRLKDVDEIADFFGSKGIESFSWVFASVACIIYALSLSWKLTVLSFISIPLLTFLMNKTGKMIAGFSKKTKEVTSDINSYLLQAINGNKEIKSFSLKQSISDKFNKISEDIKNNSIETDIWNNIMMLIGQIGSIIPIAVAFVFGSYLIYQKEMTIGAWASYFFLMEYTNSIFSYLPSLISGYKNMEVCAERIFKLIDLPEETSGHETKLDMTTKIIVEFKDVDFTYPGYEDKKVNSKILKGVSFQVHQGEKLYIVGPSGCGKSTLFNLLTGFYRSYTGQIIYRGIDIKNLDINVLRKDISLVDQVSYLYPESIKTNIAYGMGTDKITCDIENKIKTASIIACADKFIENMKTGYETSVAEKGVSLSGGQRQRISIARSLMRSASLFLLDEVTSAIDVKNEETIISNILSNEDLTCLFIAHRLPMCQLMDRIIVMDNGRIVEEGTYENLIFKKGMFHQMLQMTENQNGERSEIG